MKKVPGHIDKMVAGLDRERRQEEQAKLYKYEALIEGTRAGKLLLKGKHFIVVAMDEDYYAQVYRTIRLHEKQRGRWTYEDECAFDTAIHMWEDFQI